MPYSCLDELGQLPTSDVVALCARDMVGEVMIRTRDVAAGLHASNATEAAILGGFALIGTLMSLRLAAFLDAATRGAASRWGAARGRRRRADLRSVVERHRRRPADTGPPRGGDP